MIVSFFTRRTALFLSSLLISGGSVAVAQGPSLVKIHEIQGAGSASPMVGKVVSIRGIVTADLRASHGGITVQSAPADFDDNPATSEGLFVKIGAGFTPAIGDFATIVGTVSESNNLTTLDNVQQYEASTATKPEPVPVAFPLPEGLTWENYESMYLTFPEQLFVTETYNYGRYGAVQLSPGRRLAQPTSFMAPGPEAYALQGVYATTGSLLLDDGNTKQNPYPLPFMINGENVRNGDSINALTGVLNEFFNSYQFISTETINWERTNPRQLTPPDVGGTVKVASYNVLNFFNGNGQGGGFPTDRGADTAIEFQRQKTKIVAGLVALNADVVGLLEIENDGFGEFSAIAELVNSVNAEIADAELHYAFVQPTATVGTDAICNAIIYRPSKLQIVGEIATLNEGPYSYRRPSIVVSFMSKASGEALTISVSHYKSKSCSNATGANADAKDGQACYNGERVEQATLLAKFLETSPTGIETENQLIIGDLNAYQMEDPIRVFTDAGFVEAIGWAANLTCGIVPNCNGVPYSYVFQGRSGLLDYALISPSLRAKMADARVWHINADEAPVLDYNTEYKSADIYDTTPFRSSDHDPVLIGLNL
ncbi:MAG: ExeM/NucH family extracellular endonuclease [Sumerlaeia bacterium]